MNAQEKFRALHRRRFDLALGLAVAFFLFLFAASPPLELRKYTAPEVVIVLIDPPPEVTLPPPPPEIRRPVLPVETLDDADPEREMDDTRFDPLADVVAPPPPPPMTGFTAIDREPEPLQTVPPEYPDMARMAEIEGVVECLVTVGIDGRVVRVEVVSSDAKVLEKSAVAAIERWVFRPAEQSGQPVEATIRIRYRFRLRR